MRENGKDHHQYYYNFKIKKYTYEHCPLTNAMALRHERTKTFTSMTPCKDWHCHAYIETMFTLADTKTICLP